MKKKLIIILSIILSIGIVVIGIICSMFPIVVFGSGYLFTSPETYRPIDNNQYIAWQNNEDDYNHIDWMDDSKIWPCSIDKRNGGRVKEIKATYWCPFDPQQVEYLVMQYDDENYFEEIKRLEKIGIDKYTGYYSVTGFKQYELVAMCADPEAGFVYALTDGNDTVVYVNILFCNYFMDTKFKYEKYMPAEYFPDGFNAKDGNPDQKKFDREWERSNGGDDSLF